MSGTKVCQLSECIECGWVEPQHEDPACRHKSNQELKLYRVPPYQGCRCPASRRPAVSSQLGTDQHASRSPSLGLPPAPGYHASTPVPAPSLYRPTPPLNPNRSPVPYGQSRSTPSPQPNTTRPVPPPPSNLAPPQMPARKSKPTGNFTERDAFLTNQLGAAAAAAAQRAPQAPQFQANIIAPNLREVKIYQAPAAPQGRNVQLDARAPAHVQSDSGYGLMLTTTAQTSDATRSKRAAQHNMTLPAGQSLPAGRGKLAETDWTTLEEAIVLKLRDERPFRAWYLVRRYIPGGRTANACSKHYYKYIEPKEHSIRASPEYQNYVPPIVPPYP